MGSLTMPKREEALPLRPIAGVDVMPDVSLARLRGGKRGRREQRESSDHPRNEGVTRNRMPTRRPIQRA